MEKQEIINTLKEIGLEDNEAEIYIILLENGQSSANFISKKTNLHRRTIYDTLDRLSQKNLASGIRKDGVKIFRALNPKRLKQDLKQKQNNLKKIMPDISKLYKEKKYPAGISIHTGKNSVKPMVEDAMKSKKEILMMGRGGKTMDVLQKSAYQYFGKLATTKWRMIQKRIKGLNKKIGGFRGGETRYLDSKHFYSAFCVAGNNVYIYLPDKEHTIIRIHNKKTAITYKTYFEILWKIAKKR